MLLGVFVSVEGNAHQDHHDGADKDKVMSVEYDRYDDDDDDFGFDPELHVWHPPENPDVGEEKPNGIYSQEIIIVPISWFGMHIHVRLLQDLSCRKPPQEIQRDTIMNDHKDKC